MRGQVPATSRINTSHEGIACVAGVQRGGRGEVECERERDRYFNFPPPSPLYVSHAG